DHPGTAPGRPAPAYSTSLTPPGGFPPCRLVERMAVVLLGPARFLLVVGQGVGAGVLVRELAFPPTDRLLDPSREVAVGFLDRATTPHGPAGRSPPPRRVEVDPGATQDGTGAAGGKGRLMDGWRRRFLGGWGCSRWGALAFLDHSPPGPSADASAPPAP